MQQATIIAAFRFQRVPERMAEIQQGAPIGLALVLSHDLRLGFAAGCDRMGQRCSVSRQHRFSVGAKPIEERGISQGAILNDLGITSPHFPVGQAVQHVRVGQNGDRLIKGADKIFALRGINSRFPTNGAIDLRQKRRRDLHIGQASQRNRRGKSAEITDDPAP